MLGPKLGRACLCVRATQKETARYGAVDFLGDSVVENLLVNAEDTGLIPGLGRFHMPQNN